MPQAKTVLVTGAAKRLGKAVAQELASHGWQIALHYHHSASEAAATVAELSALGAVVQGFQADLNSAAACRGLFADVLARFGQVDALVNSASQFEHDEPRKFEAELAQAHFAVNCIAPVLLAQCLHEHVSGHVSEDVSGHERRQGAVVNLLDQKLWNLNPDFFSYTLSKAALQAATSMMAQAYAPALRVCGVAPGLTLASYLQDETSFAKAHQVSPLGRSSQPVDVARTVRFVLENESMTGSQVLVDGGQHLMHLPRDISFL